MIVKKRFPTLYAKSSTGKIKVWQIWVAEDGECPKIITQYGQQDGKMQRTTVKVREGKNIGRSNATTPLEQAVSEAESKWTKQKDKKYVENKSGKSDKLLPMLAHDFKKRGHHIEWPAYVQPKINGLRCLTKRMGDSIEYHSRGGKSFETLAHLTPHLLSMMREGEVFDGELFTRELTFQEIVSAVKRRKTENPNTSLIQYWVYDVVLPQVPFRERTDILGKLVAPGLPIIFVDTALVFDKKAMLLAHSVHIEQGFEGTIIRNSEGVYRCDFRSPDLQKYKEFVDEEFMIVGGKQGVGRAEGTITWTCVTEEGKEFDARPTGTEEERRFWWDNLDKFIGKKITVRYQNLSDDGIPIFPVAVGIRDYE